jgi:NAD(P)-dependent dehydrogenase (short-subunit alcohol dehydrogenase family)
MDIAIVTGASSSLGLAISRRLIQLGFRVYGLGGDYKDCALNNVNFRPVPCDLADPGEVESACLKILESEKGIFLVINNAKYFGRQPFLEMDPAEIERILRINLLCPLVLVKTLGESLKELQGYIIQLGATHAETGRGGAAGAAASGGLKWMSDILFQELRGHGVKVCHLSPEPNRGQDLPRKSRPGARPEAVIDPEAVAQAVEQILQSPFGNVVTEMILRPLRIDEPEQDPVREIPYPEPQPIPYTVPREYIEAEDQLEEEDWQKEQQAKRERNRAKKTAKKAVKKAAKKAVKSKEPEREKAKPTATNDSSTPSPDEGTETEKPRRRSRRKPRPPRVEVGFLDKAGKPPPEDKATTEKVARKQPRKQARKRTRSGNKPAARDNSTPDKEGKSKETADRKDPAKKAVKKAARKAARKRPAKKASSKPDNRKEKD